MDNATQVKLQNLMRLAETVNPGELNTVIDRYFDKIEVLSLDCFDTILWRKTSTPKDVFFDLQHRPNFISQKFNAALRMSAEGRARHLSMLRDETPEVKLKDIYREGFKSDLTEEEINQLLADEIAEEAAVIYAFPPIVDLIKQAHQRGIKVIVVSDTYFEETQLRQILASKLPKEAYDAIDKVFCSCEYKKSKADGLFKQVLPFLRCQPEKILHIGDNGPADYLAPRFLQINALHFVFQDEYTGDLMRLQDTAAKILDPSIGVKRSLPFPYRGVFATQSLSKCNPETLIGYAALGPIMYAFSKFVCDDVKRLQQEGKSPKVLFLMRDAYLPSLACEAMSGAPVGKRVRISRFASYAASFRSLEDIDSYLIEVGKSNRFQDMARQLLLPEKVAEPIIRVAENSQHPVNEFLKLIRRTDIVRIILNKSTEYRARLIRHLEKEVSLKSGDTLMLVDLGYSGTAQRRLTGIFNDIGVEVRGCYLLSLEVPDWEKDRRGLIDASWCDDRAMRTVVFYITLLEQLCTSNEKSVVDYDANGEPIYSDVVMSEQQHEKLTRIQAECLRFIRDAKQFFTTTYAECTDDTLRRAAFIELSRLIFLPTEAELNYLRSFEAEMNLGTQDILQIFDPEKGLMGLRRRGMFYMEKPSRKTRTNYPAELRSASIELVLSLMAQHRFGLDLKLKDIVVRKEMIPIIFKQGNETFKTTVEAVSTHDGFFSVWLPANLQTHIVLGENYQWVQIESAEFITMDGFVSQNEAQNTASAASYISFNDTIDNSGNLFKFTSATSAMVLMPYQAGGSADYVFRLVFRPIIKQDNKPKINAFSTNVENTVAPSSVLA